MAQRSIETQIVSQQADDDILFGDSQQGTPG